MSDFVDYSRYSLEQLCDVAQHIDREKYPAQFESLTREIEKQEQNHAEVSRLPEPEGENSFVPQEPQVMRGGCVGCFVFTMVGAAAGIAVALAWLSFCLMLFQPAPLVNMDGLNRWGGHVAAVMFGALIGSLGGFGVAIRHKPLQAVAAAAAILFALLLFVDA